MQLFDREAVGHKTDGQPVEQGLVVGPLTESSEVVGGTDQPVSEVSLPDAVDQHSSRQRVAVGCDPASQFQPPAAGSFERLLVEAGGDSRKPARDPGAAGQVVAPEEDLEIRAIAVIDGHRLGDGTVGGAGGLEFVGVGLPLRG